MVCTEIVVFSSLMFVSIVRGKNKLKLTNWLIERLTNTVGNIFIQVFSLPILFISTCFSLFFFSNIGTSVHWNLYKNTEVDNTSFQHTKNIDGVNPPWHSTTDVVADILCCLILLKWRNVKLQILRVHRWSLTSFDYLLATKKKINNF